MSEKIPLLFEQLNELEKIDTCIYIYEMYLDVKNMLCGQKILGTFGSITLLTMIIAILSLFNCWLSVKMVRKMEYRKILQYETISTQESQQNELHMGSIQPVMVTPHFQVPHPQIHMRQPVPVQPGVGYGFTNAKLPRKNRNR